MSCFIDDFQKHNATLFPKMSPFKVFNLVLISGTVLYFLLYVLTIGHLPHVPVVKIYFEEEPSEGDLAYFPRDFTHETSLNFGAGIMKDDGLNSSSTPELSVKDERASEELTGEKENSAKRSSLLSFLEGLGVPINKARILMASDISNNVLPRVNPNGFSLAKLMEKMDKEFNLESGTPCPTSHLNSGKFKEYRNKKISEGRLKTILFSTGFEPITHCITHGSKHISFFLLFDHVQRAFLFSLASSEKNYAPETE